MTAARSLGLAVALTALATPAWAVDFEVGGTVVSLEITESLFLDYHTFLDDPQILADEDKSGVFDLRNRLNVRLRADRFTLGVRLDAAWFPSPPANPGRPSQYKSDLRPEEIFVTGRFGDVTLTLGDDYLSFGRGLALSMRKIDELGFATSLRGVHAQWRTPRVRTRLAAGLTNVVNVDNVEEKLVPDPSDLVVAARVEAEPVDGLKLGAHVVDIERRHAPAREAIAGALTGDDATAPINGTRFIRTTIAGFNVEVPSLLDVVSLYGEVAFLSGENRRDTAAGERTTDVDGLAVYAQAQAYLGPLTIQAEAKHYDDFVVDSTLHPDTAQAQGVTQTFAYITPPSLERIDQRVLNNTDVTGASLRVDYAIPDRSDSLFLSGAWFVDAPSPDDTTIHVYGGFEHNGTGGDRLLLQAGYRREAAPGGDLLRLRMIHFDLDLFHVFSEHVDIHLHWNHEFRDKNVGAPALQDTYVEGTSYLSVNLPPRWSLTAQLEYLTDAATSAPVFVGGFVQYRFTRASFVRLFAGRSKGGLKCSGGVCRIFPDFEGVKLETTVRF